MVDPEKVRTQFLSLRQIIRGSVFSGRSPWQLSPASVAISNLSSGLPTDRVVLLFSERPVSLRTSGLHSFGTVLEIQSFRVTYELQRKSICVDLSDGREPPIPSTKDEQPAPPAKLREEKIRTKVRSRPLGPVRAFKMQADPTAISGGG
jgi:hypothetical protein